MFYRETHCKSTDGQKIFWISQDNTSWYLSNKMFFFSSNVDKGPISDVQSLVTKPHIEGDPSSFLDVFDLTQK